MYGYRTDLMPYTRVYVPRRVAANFRGIHESETALRFQLENDPEGATSVLRVPRGTRPTRPNAVDNNYFRVIPANTAQITAHRVAVDHAKAQEFLRLLHGFNVPVSVEERTARVTPVPFDRVLEIVEAVPVVDNDAGQWNSDAILQILQEYRRQHGDFGFVYVRKLDGALDRTRARLSGVEVTTIRNASNNMPTVVLLYTGDDANNPEGWHPTLVMPPNAPTMIVSPSTP
jgi:hypothetical protein